MRNNVTEECVHEDFLFEQFLTVFYDDFKYSIQKLLNTKKEGDNVFLIEYFARKLTIPIECYNNLHIFGKYLLLKKNPSFKEDIEKAINYTNDWENDVNLGCCFMNIHKSLKYIELDLTDLEMIEKKINNNLSE